MRYIVMLALLLASSLQAQTIEEYLDKVKSNSPYLRSEHSLREARIRGSRAGINPENPEIAYGYMPGVEQTNATRQSYEFTQNFEWFGGYFARSAYGKLERRQADVDLAGARYDILLRAKMLCYELVYLTRMESSVGERIAQAERLFASVQKMYSSGAATSVDLNRAQINLNNMRSDLTSVRNSAVNVRDELQVISGTDAVSGAQFTYDEEIAADLNSLYEKALNASPEIASASLESAKSAKNISVQRASTLPSISIGAAGERISPEDSFLGVKAGLSIPLWGGVNKVKTAKAESQTQRLREENVRSDVALALKKQVAEIRTLRERYVAYDNLKFVKEGKALLEKSFAVGALTAIDYLTQMEYYLSQEEEFLANELALQNALAMLKRNEL